MSNPYNNVSSLQYLFLDTLNRYNIHEHSSDSGMTLTVHHKINIIPATVDFGWLLNVRIMTNVVHRTTL